MIKCPYCDRSTPDYSLRCAACTGNITLLARLQELPDAQFNQALRAARKGDSSSAMNLLGAVLHARRGDADAWSLLGTLHARQQGWLQARKCWDMALLLKPDHTQARVGLRSLDLLAAEESSPVVES